MLFLILSCLCAQAEPGALAPRIKIGAVCSNREAILEHNRRLGEIQQQIVEGDLDSEGASQAFAEAERTLRQPHGQEAP